MNDGSLPKPNAQKIPPDGGKSVQIHPPTTAQPQQQQQPPAQANQPVKLPPPPTKVGAPAQAAGSQAAPTTPTTPTKPTADSAPVSARPTALSPQQRKLLQKQQNSPAGAQPLPKPRSRFTSVQSNALPEGAGQAQEAPAQPQQPGQLRAAASAPPPQKDVADPKPDKPAGARFAVSKTSFWKNPLLLGALGLVLLVLIGGIIWRLLSSASPTSTTPTTNQAGSQNQNQNGSGSSGGSQGSAAGQQPNASSQPQPVSQPTSLTYWGLWEPTEVMQSVFDEFERQRPGVTINYIKQSHKSYRERLIAAISSGNGPDMYRYHASWTPMLKEELAPVPASVMTSADFQQLFYPVALQQLQLNGQPVGIPLMYDGLVLYVNDEALQKANETPPQTWSELKTLAAKLTVRSGGTIDRAGLAIGNATNVEHFSDILAVLMLQNGADLANPNSPEGRDALLFYTNFVKADKVWSDELPNSTVAFARGDVAMMFAPSWRAHEIAALNPDLKFSTSPLPTLADTKLSWASYWAEGVNSKSKNNDLAWELLEFLSQKETQLALHADQAEVRGFGQLYSRKDLADELAASDVAAAVLEDAPHAQGWYMSSYTHDNGINDQIIQYYENAVTSVLSGTSVEDALVPLDRGVKQVLKQYGAE